MLTPENLRTMTPEERTAAFEGFVRIVYADVSAVGPAICADLDITPPTYFAWRRDNRVPQAAILLMQEWAMSQSTRAEMKAWADIAHDLSQVTRNLEALSVFRAAALSQSVSAEPLRKAASRKSSAE